MKIRLAAIAMMAFAAVPLEAQGTRTCSNSVGTLADNAFSGSGIPTDNSQIATCSYDIGTSEYVGLTLGLRAHQRGTNAPPVAYAGSGIYLASAGPDASTGPLAQPGYATWNFGFYVSGQNASQYTYRLFYDFNGESGNSIDLGQVNFAGGQYGDSWNLGMGFLSATVPNVIAPPTGPAFNPNSGGEYSFRLAAYEATGAKNQPFASTSMTVVTSTVPEPSTYVLMASGLLGLFVAHRRRRNA